MVVVSAVMALACGRKNRCLTAGGRWIIYQRIFRELVLVKKMLFKTMDLYASSSPIDRFRRGGWPIPTRQFYQYTPVLEYDVVIVIMLLCRWYLLRVVKRSSIATHKLLRLQHGSLYYIIPKTYILQTCIMHNVWACKKKRINSLRYTDHGCCL